MWTDTHLSEPAKELVTVDNLIKECDLWQAADQEGFAMRKRGGAQPMIP